MPIYEFECKSCETTREEIVPMGATDGPVCPDCQTPMERRLSATADYRPAGAGTPKAACCGAADQGAPPSCAGGSCPFK